MSLIKTTFVVARNLYNMGQSVTLCPNKAVPHDGPFSLGISVCKHSRDRDFKKLTNEFAYYNCTSETGNKISYYREA